MTFDVRNYDIIKELNNEVVEYSFPFPLLQKVLKLTKKRRSYNRKHKLVFFSEHSVVEILTTACW